MRGAAILFAPGDAIAGHGRGRVTSVAYSPTLGRYVGLGFYSGGMGHDGIEILAAYPMKGEVVRVRVTSPIFLGRQGERLRG